MTRAQKTPEALRARADDMEARAQRHVQPLLDKVQVLRDEANALEAANKAEEEAKKSQAQKV